MTEKEGMVRCKNKRSPQLQSPSCSRLIFLIAILLCVAAAAAVDRWNFSGVTAGDLWATAKEDVAGDLDAVDVIDGEGGFSTLDGMLQWAISHADPVKLEETAADTRSLSSVDLEKRRIEIKELLDKFKTPSDAHLMLAAINALKNASLSIEGYNQALTELLTLVEPIDNANDLHKLGGLIAVIDKLNSPDQYTRRTAAWVIGKACQNNPLVQNQVLELGALPRLLEMVKSNYVQEGIKAMYSVSSLVRNNLYGQQIFYSIDGHSLLQGIICNGSGDSRLLKKALLLVADLSEWHLEHKETPESSFFGSLDLLKSVVSIASSPADYDLQEKALLTIRNLLLLSSTEAMVFKDACDLEGALKRMKICFSENADSAYAYDLEQLRHQVELIFIHKLTKSAGTHLISENGNGEVSMAAAVSSPIGFAL